MYTYRAKLLRAVDGDTLDLLVDCGFGIWFEERFRLYGVDTPEVYGPNACPEGTEASEFVRETLEALGPVFMIETIKDRKGKYGRYLADIFLSYNEDQEPVMLSDYLVENGQAVYKEY